MTEDQKKKLFTRNEIKNHSDNINTNLVIINDKVYDLMKFLNDHPGGEEVLIEQRGQDASEVFNDVGHSGDAREMMKSYLIGELVESERNNIGESKQLDWSNSSEEAKKNKQKELDIPYGVIVVTVIVLFLAYYLGMFTSS